MQNGKEIDYNNIAQLNELYTNLNDIRIVLNDLLDAGAIVEFELYKAVSEAKIKPNLGEKGLLIELIRCGQFELVERYVQSQKDIVKAKNAFRLGMEAINLKKHVNNISPR